MLTPSAMLRAVLPGCALALLVVAASVAALLVAPVPVALSDVPASPSHGKASGTVIMADSARCAEDDPCWHWPTMGNRARGIVTLWGTPVVVGPCRFRRMMERRSAKDRRIMGYGMRGDAWAMRHGCER